jgi:hypothetical protein
MPSFAAGHTKRNLFKLASLGLAGLLAGLLTGCNTLIPSSNNQSQNVYSEYFRPTSSLPESLDATQIPALHHPPSSRRLQIGSLHTVSQSVATNGRNRS